MKISGKQLTMAAQRTVISIGSKRPSTVLPLLLMFVSGAAHAAALAGAGLPWDSVLCTFVSDLQSTVAAAVAVAAIVLAGLSYAHSDADWFKFLMAVIMGVGIAAGSVTIVSWFGLNFGCASSANIIA